MSSPGPQGNAPLGPGNVPGGTPTDRAALGARLAELEVGVYTDLAGLADTAEDLRVAADAAGWAHEAARARLVLADVSGRTDRLEGGAQAQRDILVEAMLAGDDLLAARAHHLLGASLDRLGLTTEALAHAADGVHLLPADAPGHLRVEHTMLLALMSSQQLSGNGFRSSFEQVVADAATLPTPELLLAALNNYAWLLYERGETADASAVVGRLEDVAARTGVRLNSAALDTVARVLLDRGELDRAEEMARAAIASDAPTTSRFTAGEAMLTLAEIRWRRGDADSAYLLATGAEQLALEHAMPEIRALALRQKAKLLADRGDFRGAYEASTAYHELWETVRSRETDSRAVLLQTVLGTDEARRRSAVYEELAERDPLTGVWNRRHLTRLFPAMLGEADAGGRPLSVAIVDVDRFKSVNDRRDHQVGDAVLCRVAELLDAQVTEPAFPVRLGGDEFLLVLPGLDEAAAIALVERARAAVEAEDWSALTDGLAVTISAGVATSGKASTHSDLMRRADENMYRAKRSGRNTVRGGGRAVPEPGPTAGEPGPDRRGRRSPAEERATGTGAGTGEDTEPRHSAGDDAVDRAPDPDLVGRGRPLRPGAHRGADATADLGPPVARSAGC